MKQNWVPCLTSELKFRLRLAKERKNSLRTPPRGFMTEVGQAGAALGMAKGEYIPTGEGRPLHCVQNVQQYLQGDAGEAQPGHIVWYCARTGGIGVEPHVVVRRPNGTLLDVTAQASGEKFIYFVPQV